MKKLKIRQLEELKVCPFNDGICINRSEKKTCELLPVCFEVAKLKLLKEISENLKSKRRGSSDKVS